MSYMAAALHTRRRNHKTGLGVNDGTTGSATHDVVSYMAGEPHTHRLAIWPTTEPQEGSRPATRPATLSHLATVRTCANGRGVMPRPLVRDAVRVVVQRR